MTPQEKKQLQVMACKVRMGVIEGVHAAKSGHPGGSLSAADMFTYLYFKELRVDPKNPQWEDRDRFVLSKGHTAPGLYAALALRGEPEVDAGRVQIVFTRALPVNELEIAQTVSTYRGLVPDRLLLTQVPFVEDARAVLGEEDAGQGDEEE